jgi:hypothetical protein
VGAPAGSGRDEVGGTAITIQAYGKVAAEKVATPFPLGRGTVRPASLREHERATIEAVATGNDRARGTIGGDALETVTGGRGRTPWHRDRRRA